MPPEVHYVSFTADSDEIARKMGYSMDDDIVDAVTEAIQFWDLSPDYFQLSPIPREWYVGEARTIEDLGKAEGTDDVLGGWRTTSTNTPRGTSSCSTPSPIS